MKNFTATLLLAGIFCLISFQSRATHAIGGEIFYKVVAPGVFKATYKGYYDLGNSSIATPATINFNLRAPGCFNGVVITGNKQSQYQHYINGPISNRCTNLTQVVQVVEYTATFTLSQTSCQEWKLGVRECQVYLGANFPPSSNSCHYVEATITNPTIGLQKSSPEFLPQTSWFFNLNEPATYSNLAIQEQDPGDSVVYSLTPALTDNNVPLTYINNLSFSQPLPTSSGVVMHPNTGTMTFTPNVFFIGSTNSNRYAIVVEAAVYRKINGVPTKVSASQRLLPIYIVNNSSNNNPTLLNVLANGQPVQPNAVVEMQTGNPLTFQFNTADANVGDTLKLVLPDAQFPGLPLNTTVALVSGTRPSGTLTFNPPASATSYLFYFPVTVMDNACLTRGVTTQVYGIRVLASPTGKKEDFTQTNFTAFPNPFTDEVSFKFESKQNAESILIYNLLGQQIDQIKIANVNTEQQQVRWENAGKFASGTYVARLISETKIVQTLKFTKLQ